MNQVIFDRQGLGKGGAINIINKLKIIEVFDLHLICELKESPIKSRNVALLERLKID